MAVLALPSVARGEGSAAVGVGMYGDRPAASLQLGVDVGGAAWALGIGGRVQWLAGEGLDETQWDDAAEWVRVVRYASYGGERLTLRLQSLTDARLGDGAVIAGYTAGLDVDHPRLGAAAGWRDDDWTADVIVDDVIAPGLAGARVTRALGDWELGGELVAFERGAVAVDVARRWRGVRGYAAGVYLPGLAAAGELGARVELARDGVTLAAQGELGYGTAGYVPRWAGPLYELERRDQLEHARAADDGAPFAFVETVIDVDAVGVVASSFQRRPIQGDVVTVRVASPYYQRVQAAAWAALALGGPAAVAGELRVSLPGRWFASADAARLYRGDAPLWQATVAVGAVVW